MTFQDPYETYGSSQVPSEHYQEYQDEIKSLLKIFIRNFGRIQLMHRLGTLTVSNTAKFLNIGYRKANLVVKLYGQWTMGIFDL